MQKLNTWLVGYLCSLVNFPTVCLVKCSLSQVTVRSWDLSFLKYYKIVNLKIPAKSFWSQGRSLIAWSSLNVTFLQKFNKLFSVNLNSEHNIRTCGFITEQSPKSVPKNGRKLVVLAGRRWDPYLDKSKIILSRAFG